MKDDEQIEERVGVVCDPEQLEVVVACEVGEHVDDGAVQGQQDTGHACDRLPKPVMKFGQHVGPGERGEDG